MKLRLLFLIPCLIFFLFVAPARIYSNALVISQVQGKNVEILKKGDTKWSKASTGQPLSMGDKIRTGDKSHSILISQEGHKFLIKQQTVFEISQLGPLNWEFEEEGGRVRIKAQKLDSTQSLKVKTPTAICSVRGTEFEIAFENSRTTLDVYQGVVGLTDVEHAAPEIYLLENQRSVIEAGAPPKTPELIPEKDRIQEPGFSDHSQKGPTQPESGVATGPDGKPINENLTKEMKTLEEKFRQLDPNDTEGKEKLEKERFELMQKSGMIEYPNAPSKEEMISRMKEDFNQTMQNFNGSPEEKAKIEKEFNEHLEELNNKEGMPPDSTRSPDQENREPEERYGWNPSYDNDLKNEIRNETNYDIQRDQYEENVKDELKLELVQTNKELIDRSGRRVRFEENVTRPTPDSFKLISLSRREGREDSVVFEVIANKILPENLEDAGNLWFSQQSTKPEWYAIKQRVSMTNGQDSIQQLFLDGDSKEVTFSNSFIDSGGKFITTSESFQTVFDHRYEFLNGESSNLEKIWSELSFRPSDSIGMMWHMRPILVQRIDPTSQRTPPTFWEYTFVTTSGSGTTATGKSVITQYSSGSTSNLAHFIKSNSYINFVDTNGNGRLDRGESYEDLNGNGARDESEPFYDVVQLGINGTQDTSRKFNGTADTTYFSDLNRDNLNNDDTSGSDAFKVASRPWANLKEEMLLIDDKGEIIDMNTIGFGSINQNKGDQNTIADLFEKLNMERVFTSSEFSGRDIDVIMTPRTFLRAKMIELKLDGNEEIDSRR